MQFRIERRRTVAGQQPQRLSLKGSSLPQAPHLESLVLHCFLFLLLLLVFLFVSLYIFLLSNTLHLVLKPNTLTHSLRDSTPCPTHCRIFSIILIWDLPASLVLIVAGFQSAIKKAHSSFSTLFRCRFFPFVQLCRSLTTNFHHEGRYFYRLLVAPGLCAGDFRGMLIHL